jgi:hypothetical protein
LKFLEGTILISLNLNIGEKRKFVIVFFNFFVDVFIIFFLDKILKVLISFFDDYNVLLCRKIVSSDQDFYVLVIHNVKTYFNNYVTFSENNTSLLQKSPFSSLSPQEKSSFIWNEKNKIREKLMNLNNNNYLLKCCDVFLTDVDFLRKRICKFNLSEKPEIFVCFVYFGYINKITHISKLRYLVKNDDA